MQSLKGIKLLFIGYFFICINLFAQENHVRFEHLTINDGLSQSSVRAIYQDSYGFMWFGSNDGLNRYDGYDFKIFKNDPSDSTSIINNIIYDIAEDNNGYLWIATSNGLSRYNRFSNTFKQFSFPNIVKENSTSHTVYSLLVISSSSTKMVWFSTLSGVFCYNENEDQLKFYRIIDYENASDIDKKIYLHEDRNGEVWAITNMYGIHKWNSIDDKFEEIINSSKDNGDNLVQLTPAYEDKSGIFWFGSISGLSRFDPITGEITFYKSQFQKALGERLTTSFINSIAEDDDGNMFLATSGYGLIRFNKFTNDIKVYTNDPYNNLTISLNVVHKVFFDNSGVLWMGTDGKGVDKLSPYLNNFNSVLRSKGGLSINSVRTFFEDRKRYLWIAGYDGLDRFEPRSRDFKSFYTASQNNNSKKINEIVYTIIEDKEQPNKYLYFGTEGIGVYRYNILTETFDLFFHSDSLYGENLVSSLYDDGNGYLWIGTNNNLIKFRKYDGTYKKYVHNPKDSLSISPQRITDIFEDSYGDFWIGTDQGGLNLMDKQNGTFIKYQQASTENQKGKYENKQNKFISGNFVKCIYEDSRRNLWIGTTNGLNNFNRETGTFKKYTVEDGLPNNVIYGILEDEQGRLWISTNYGLSCFSVSAGSFKNYDFQDGLQSNEFNTNAYYKTKDGKLLFGGINGFNFFYPEEIEANTYIPNIVLTEFSLFNKTVAVGQEINGRIIFSKSIAVTDTVLLDYHENIFSLKFAAFDYSSSGKNRYSYKLTGFQDEFSTPTTNRTVTYTNLDPGEYLFTVIGSNGDGIWNNEGTSLLIIITPPFWLTWWFYLILIFVIGGGIYSAYRYRIKKILELERLRVKIASDLHDEVGSTLTKVSMRAQMLEMKTDNQQSSETLKRISEQSREAVSTMQDIVWAIDSRNDDVEDLINKMKDIAHSLLSEENLNVNFSYSGLNIDDKLSVNQRQNIYLIMKEAVHNIAKHSNAQNVEISLINTKDKFEMKIKDDGTEFSRKEFHTGQGLKNMRMRAEKIKGTVTYERSSGFEVKLITPAIVKD